MDKLLRMFTRKPKAYLVTINYTDSDGTPQQYVNEYPAVVWDRVKDKYSQCFVCVALPVY